jgi:dUTP pyrophosphatase
MSQVPIQVRIRKLPHGLSLPTPTRQTPSAAGMDLYAAISGDIVLQPMQIQLIPCGFAIEIPDGYEAQVRPRSGLSSKHGVTLVNCVGTIDADYRGEVKVPLINLGPAPYTIRHADRVAQMLILPVPPVQVIEVQQLSETQRGAGGFGHTDKH